MAAPVRVEPPHQLQVPLPARLAARQLLQPKAAPGVLHSAGGSSEHRRHESVHRAIDVAADPVEAIRACMRCGVARVLTSGGAPSAPEGVPTLRRMVDAANGMLSIAAGGGVNEGNAAEVPVVADGWQPRSRRGWLEGPMG